MLIPTGIKECLWLAYSKLCMRRELSIRTHLTDREKVLLMRLARKRGGRIFVEIGSYHGASACFIARGIRMSSRSTGARMYCVDTWKNDAMSEGTMDTWQQFRQNVSPYGGIITPLRQRSADAAASFTERVDFLFIDGDHSYAGVCEDIRAWLPRLSPRAMLVFHDYGWAEGVQRAVSELVKPLELLPGEVFENTYWTTVTGGAAPPPGSGAQGRDAEPAAGKSGS